MVGVPRTLDLPKDLAHPILARYRQPMTVSRTSQRVAQAARHNPELALRISERLPEAERSAFISELSKPAAQDKPKMLPGLRKCSPSRQAKTELARNLALFARRVSKVG